MRFSYQCPASLGSNGALRIINSSTTPADLFVDSGSATPDYLQLASGGFLDYPGAPFGESFVVQIHGAPGIVVAHVATVHRAATSDCHAQALGVLGQ